MKLKHQIPKHIYQRGEENLGEPDFYVGPTIDGDRSRSGSRGMIHRENDEDLQALMDKTVEDAKTQPGGKRQSLISLLVGLVFRGRQRPRTAR